MRRRLSLEEYVEGVRAGERAVLAAALTLVESRLPAEAALAQELLVRLLPATGGALRVGVSGAPGVGKSTLIDSLGLRLAEEGRRVAVLAVDPSSAVSGGSILGDKNRMPRLANHPRAFVRPSPSALTLGGVARRTRECLLVCEAAGYEVVLVETVGVGQSETLVAEMVDFFLVLIAPGGGDELQGIKKGILELADAVAVNKADGGGADLARRTCAEYASALRYLRPARTSWRTPALAVSGATGAGLDELWDLVERHHRDLSASSELERLRRGQLGSWMWSQIEERVLDAFRDHPEVRKRLEGAERAVREGTTTPTRAATELLGAFGLGAEEAEP